MNNTPATYHAPAERLPQDAVAAQSLHFREDTDFRAIMESIPHIVTILNSCRQIVYANNVLLKTLGLTDLASALGSRPGEALDCVHSKRMPAGCGTSLFCRTCGAVNAIVEGLEGKENARECRITTEGGAAFDFMIWAKPLDVQGERYVAFSVADISAEKRRDALERIFFHDILNTAGGVKGFASLLSTDDFSMKEMREVSGTIELLASRLIEEIKAQQQLKAAEKGELAVTPQRFSSLDFMRQMESLYAKHPAAEGKTLLLEPSPTDVWIVTDRALLQRVVGNMIKNALEASAKGGEVRLSAASEGERVGFSVHNAGVIPEPVQMQIFQRSFSTKASDRGLGTYSMKLLAEQYLKGTVSFTSTAAGGTTFTASCPSLPV